jgi:hypothetical protein
MLLGMFDGLLDQLACISIQHRDSSVVVHADRISASPAPRSTGDTPKARATYSDFLALWKDADPDTPILKEAKAEYAKLQ